MSRVISIWKDPHDLGFSTTSSKKVEFEKGLTVLVGCNGVGKTTLLHNVEEELKKEKVPCISLNTLKDGGGNLLSNSMYDNDMAFATKVMTSSEGENIFNMLIKFVQSLRKFIVNGVDNSKISDKFSLALMGKEKAKEYLSEFKAHKERWILLDAIDSGFSIDNIIDFKDVMSAVMEDANSLGIELYILVTANSYEMVSNEKCLNVAKGKYTSFKDYEDYKKFILSTRKTVNSRYKKISK